MSDFKKHASNSLLKLSDAPTEGLAFLQSSAGAWHLYPVGAFISLIDSDGTAYPYVLLSVSRREVKLKCACHREGCTRTVSLKAAFKGNHPTKEN